MKKSAILAAGLLASYFTQATAEAPYPGGKAPTVADRIELSFPNSQSVVRSAFVPGLDEGFVPQGLASFEDGFLLSGYVVANRRHYCRLYWIEVSNLTAKQQYDVPAKCSHAGGVAVSPEGQIVISDEHRLLVWTPAQNSISPLSGIELIKLSGGLKGTFLTTTPKGLVVGSYYKRRNVSAGQIFPWSVLNQRKISPADILDSVNMLPKTQGAAIMSSGDFWASSQGNPNLLSFISSAGAVEKSYPFVRGLQGVVSGENGTIWTVSESGARPYTNRSDIYPSIMQIDPGKLADPLGAK